MLEIGIVLKIDREEYLYNFNVDRLLDIFANPDLQYTQVPPRLV